MLTRNPTTQAHAQLTGLIDTKVWRKIGKLDAPAKSAWDDWELGRVDLHRTVGQESDERHENSAASETPVINVSLRVGPEQASCSALHILWQRWTSLAILEKVKP